MLTSPTWKINDLSLDRGRPACVGHVPAHTSVHFSLVFLPSLSVHDSDIPLFHVSLLSSPFSIHFAHAGWEVYSVVQDCDALHRLVKCNSLGAQKLSFRSRKFISIAQLLGRSVSSAGRQQLRALAALCLHRIVHLYLKSILV
jgi:hypothetical protein